MANPKQYEVIAPKKNFCGIGAAGVQFAYGKAIVNEGWVLEWYREHGYTIKPIEPAADEAPAADEPAKKSKKAKAEE